MVRGRRIAGAAGAVVLLVLGGGAWVLREEIAAWQRTRIVRGLLDPAKRDAVWREIGGWQRYTVEVPPEYRLELEDGDRVSEVLECPQPKGSPLYAVLYTPSWKVPGRFFALVRPDGTLVPGVSLVWAFSLQTEPLRDMNGDGILDRVMDWMVEVSGDDRGVAETVRVMAITETQETLLQVAYDRGNQDQSQKLWSWRLQESGKPGIADFVLEKAGPEPGKPALRAVYRWSAELGRYEGPAGSADGEFVRLDGEDAGLMKRFIRAGRPAE